MKIATDSLEHLIKCSVEPMGFELVGVEYLARGSGDLLRIYIDHPDGIDVDDCASVSRQISGLLDVEDPISGNYELEVSSPGLDRPLFSKEHYARFAGNRIKLETRVKIDGRRRFKGLLKGISDGDVLIVVDGEELVLPFDQVEKARLVPDF
jgi:ribosome maturation factor RimP